MHAQSMYGEIYSGGRGVVRDYRLACVYYEQAAQQGDFMAQNNLGVCYQHGRGCEQSYEKAAEWYEKSARQGHATAMTSLGALYHNGLGVPQNFKRAFDLYQQSRALGSTRPGLDYGLGTCYTYGHGVAKDYLEARRLLTLASAEGYTNATE